MDDNHVGVLLEDIQDKLQHIAEGMADVHNDIRDLKTNTAAIPDIQSDIEVIKAAVTDQSHALSEHDRRLTSLENAG